MTEVLRADGIGRSFGAKRVLTPATVAIATGRIGVLFGRNGSGKTTLLRIAAGNLPADYGVLHFRGQFVRRPRLHRLAREGLLFVPHGRLLVRGWRLRTHFDLVSRRFRTADAAPILDAFALRPFLDMPIDQLSPGEQRRAEVALILQRKPACVLADEPFLGISPLDCELIAAGFRSLARGGCGVLLTGHQPAVLLPLCDDVTWMIAGTTHALGSPADAMANDAFRRDYLGLAWKESHTRAWTRA